MHSRKAPIAAMHCLMVFAQSVRIRRMILEIAHEPNQTFWNLTINLLLESAALAWTKVLGSRSEDTHWTKVLPRNEHETTRAALHQHLGLTAEEWKTQRESIVAYRDQMCPQYDVAFKAACFMFDRIRAAVDEDWLGGIPSNLDRWSKTVSGNMRAIVRTAHAGSAMLGPNVPAMRTRR
jgi:hypothetical protein